MQMSTCQWFSKRRAGVPCVFVGINIWSHIEYFAFLGASLALIGTSRFVFAMYTCRCKQFDMSPGEPSSVRRPVVPISQFGLIISPYYFEVQVQQIGLLSR